MVHNTIHATYTETYDLNSVNGELSLLAIHTPQSNTLKKFFHGFYEQYRKMKILGCNLRMVCASRQELSPLELAQNTAGYIDPRDVLNPILFKACTGEGMNALLDQIYNASEAINPGYGSTLGHSVDQHAVNDNNMRLSYYSLLADDSFRREHPQKGITVMGLKPMVHKVVTTQPFKWNPADANNSYGQPLSNGGTPGQSTGAFGFGGQSGSESHDISDPVNPSVFVSNGLTEMPWLDTAYSKVCTFADGSGTTQGTNKAYLLQTNIPRVYMGVIVLPPTAENSVNLYYRMQIVWHILFKDFRPTQDLLPVTAPGPINTEAYNLDGTGLDEMNGYFNMYHTSSKLVKDYGSIDTTGVENVEVVNEKVN